MALLWQPRRRSPPFPWRNRRSTPRLCTLPSIRTTQSIFSIRIICSNNNSSLLLTIGHTYWSRPLSPRRHPVLGSLSRMSRLPRPGPTNPQRGAVLFATPLLERAAFKLKLIHTPVPVLLHLLLSP